MTFITLEPGTAVNLSAGDVIGDQAYILEKPAIDAVNAALAARRPLLVRGEPGIGKTQLAQAAARALGRAFRHHVIDSQTDSRDLQWRFDAIQRLAEAQVAGARKEPPEEIDRRLAVEEFLRPGVLWWAFDWHDARKQSRSPVEPDEDRRAENGVVVLIDEIDKAESELPNGLLEALGSGEFTPIGRDNRPVRADPSRPQPLVIITSNEERELPPAFLRRCFSLRLNFPAVGGERRDYLRRRAEAHFGKLDDEFFDLALELLEDDRKTAESSQRRPYPGVAEFLDLLRAARELAPAEPSIQLEKLRECSAYALGKYRGID